MIEGRCNCGSIKVTIPALPEQSSICSWYTPPIPLSTLSHHTHTYLPSTLHSANCKRAGSAPFSIVHILSKSLVTISDPANLLKSYEDRDTKSGNLLIRQFCGKCGSPVASVLGPEAEQIVIKAGLFDSTPAPGMAVFQEGRPEWVSVVKAGE
jgi:hypothetical protein